MFVFLLSLKEFVSISVTFVFVIHHRKTHEEETNERQTLTEVIRIYLISFNRKREHAKRILKC